MPRVEIREPSIGGAIDAIQVVNATDTLVFPHVDTCLGMCLLLANRSMVGGHVPMQLPLGRRGDSLQPQSRDERDKAVQGAPLTPAANAERMLVAMLRVARLQCQSAVQGLITVGDNSLGAYDLTRLGQLANTARLAHLDSSNTFGGVDVSVDGAAQTVSVRETNPPHLLRVGIAIAALMAIGTWVL